MRFDLHLRAAVRQQIAEVAEQMKSWEEEPRIGEDEQAQIRANIRFFEHTTQRPDLRMVGVDGSGDFPALSYSDSFVYVSVAQGVTYASDSVSGLREMGPVSDPLVQVAWIPEEQSSRHAALDKAFADLAGMDVRDVIEESDYRLLKPGAGRRNGVKDLVDGLIRPHATDAGNIGLQLRSAAELGALLRQIEQGEAHSYALTDGTLSLPMVGQRATSLFYEHLKRLCCVRARQRGIGYFALSKSHGLPAMETIEALVNEVAGKPPGETVEHWYLRLPLPEIDPWELTAAQGRRLPPEGAVSYLVRFHRTTAVMRLDMDLEYWKTSVRGETKAETEGNEKRIMQDLDYASHDQRCYGYPYPLKAAHDRASLTQAERTVLRKQIIDAAVQAGMKRTLFRDASQATGHK